MGIGKRFSGNAVRIGMILVLTLGILILLFIKTRTLTTPKGANSIDNWVLITDLPGDAVAAQISVDPSNAVFRIKPENGNVKINSGVVKKTAVLSDRDEVTINGKDFIFRTLPYQDEYKLVLNRTFEDAGIEGKGMFAIGGPLKGQELDPKIWRRLLLVLNPKQIEAVVPKEKRDEYNGIVATVVPGDGKRFCGNETRVFWVKSQYPAVQIEGGSSIGTSGQALENNGILNIGSTQVRFQLSREIRPFLKTDRDSLTGRKTTYTTAIDYGWLKVSVLTSSPAKSLFGAVLKDKESGKLYSLSLSHPNRVVGQGALVGPVNGFVVPDVLDGMAIRSQIATLLNDNNLVDSSNGFLAFKPEPEIQSADPVSRKRYQQAVRDGIISKAKQVMKDWNRALGVTGFAFQWDFRVDGKAVSLASGPGWEWAKNKNGQWKSAKAVDLVPVFRWMNGPVFRVTGDVNRDGFGRVSPGEWWFRTFINVKNPGSLRTIRLQILPFSKYKLFVNGEKVNGGAFHFVPDNGTTAMAASLFKKGKNEIMIHVSFDGSALPAFHRPFFHFSLLDSKGTPLLTKKDLTDVRATVTRWIGWQNTPKMGNSWSPVLLNPSWMDNKNAMKKGPFLWYDEPWLPLKEGDLIRYFKYVLPKRLSGKTVHLSSIASSGKVRAYFNGRLVQEGDSLQVGQGRNWLAFEVKSSYRRLTKLAKPGDGHNVNQNAIAVYNYRIRNPFGQKTAGRRGRFLEWDMRNEPALIQVDNSTGFPLFRLSIPETGMILWFPAVDAHSKVRWDLNKGALLFRPRKTGGVEAVNLSGRMAIMLRYPKIKGAGNDPAPMIAKRFDVKKLQPWRGGVRSGDEIIWGEDIFRAVHPHGGAVPDVWVVDEKLAFSSTNGIWKTEGRGFARIIRESNGFALAVNGKVGLSRNGKKLAEGQVALKDGDLLIFPDGTQWLFTSRMDGVLAETRYINGHPRRWYPAGANSLSTVVGVLVNGVPYGMERSLNGLLKGKNKSEPMDVQLTLDSTMQRMVTEELLFQNDLLKARDKIRIQNQKAKIKAIDKKLQKIRNRLAEVAPDSNEIKMLSKRQGYLLKKRQEPERKLLRLEKKQYAAAFLLMEENGAIRAACSLPFVNVSDIKSAQQEWKKLETDFSKSGFVNRCWEMSYPPGSSFKLITALTLLESAKKNRIIRRIIQSCPYGGQQSANLKGAELANGKIVGIQLRNFKRETFPVGVNLQDAFVHSYNTWFAYSALHLSKSVMEYSLAAQNPNVLLKYGFLADDVRYDDYPLLKMAQAAGFNSSYDFLSSLSLNDRIRFGIDRSYHQTNRYGSKLIALPSAFEVNAYTVGELAKSAIGQQIVRVTPLQQLINISLVGNDGTIIPPRILEGFYRNGKRQFQLKAPRVTNPNLDSFALNTLRKAMREVTLTGTAKAVFASFPYRKRVYCKTGTAETNIRDEDSWLIGFFEDPVDKKTWYFACVFPDSGEGSRVAGETVRRVLEQLLIWQKRQFRLRENE